MRSQNERHVVRLIHASAAQLLFISCSFAAPPLSSDDASVLEPGTCQLEIEQRRFNRRVELDVVPACNLFWGAEVGIGKLRTTPEGQPRSDSVVYQVKKVLVPGGESPWSFGIGAASIRATGHQSGTRQDLLNAIFTRPIGASVVHLNIGQVRESEAVEGAPRHRHSWAVAIENEVNERWTLVAEVVGQKGMPESAQAGLRWWAIAKYVQLTTSLGMQRGEGREGRWMSLGIRFETGNALF